MLLDTHALVWLASDLSELTQVGMEHIQEHAHSLHVSSISALEIALLTKRNRLDLPIAAEDFFERALKQHGIKVVPIDQAIAFRSAMLPDHHHDPFDRLIIATAQLKRLVIMTKDRTIPRYEDVRTVW